MKESSSRKQKRLYKERVRSLRIGGFLPFSLLDYPQHLSAVVFCQGCSWKCRYCYNSQLQPFFPDRKLEFQWDQILDCLKERRQFLESVIFSGGEPLLQPYLIRAIDEVKNLGFKVGLHTSGSSFRHFHKTLPYLDWVGFDIKASPESYPEITGISNSADSSWKSLYLLLKRQIPYECRTTIHPMLHSKQEIRDIAQHLHKIGVRHYVIQYFQKKGCNDEKLKTIDSHFSLDADLFNKLSMLFDTFSVR